MYRVIVVALLVVSQWISFVQITPTPSPKDDTILTQEPCAFPCWNNIIPGESTTEEVNEILKNVSFYTSAKIKFTDDYQSPRHGFQLRHTIEWSHTDVTEISSIVLDDDVVYSIYIIPNAQLTLGDILSSLGNPDGINVNYDFGGEQIRAVSTLELYYPKFGLIVDFQLFFVMGSPYVPSVTIDKNIPLINYRLYQSADNLDDFLAQSDHLWSYFPAYRGWPGIGTIIMSPDPQTLPHSFPTYILPTPNPDATATTAAP